VLSKIVSKVLVDKGILGGCGEEVLFLIFTILGFIEGNMGKGLEVVDRGRGDGGTSDNILWAVRDIEEREVFNVVKSRPDELRGLRDDGLEDAGGDVKRTWVIPSVVRALKDLKDGSGGICNVLLVNVIKGGPGGDRDVGKGGGGNDCQGRSPRHYAFKESQVQVLPKPPLS